MSHHFPVMHLPRTIRPDNTKHAFTLVELLVSTAILSLIMVVLVSMVGQTGSMWHYTTSKIEQFREAREGYEAMTRRLSQATLNTYWDYDNPNKPTRYIRQSELRFISGPGLAGTNSSTPPRPTHSVFFFAPLGFVIPDSTSDTTAQNYEGLENLLNLWGYFTEYGDDTPTKPTFVTALPRNRFRLYELMQPSQDLTLYQLEKSKSGGNLAYVGHDWFQNAIAPAAASGSSRQAHVLAENVIALIILPKLTPQAQTAGNYTDASLAPNYFYDSTGTGMTTLGDANLNPKNQLPPIVQVAMVAIDETSALRMTNADTSALNQKLGSLFTNPNNFEADLEGTPGASSDNSLQAYLNKKRISYRIFTTDISIKGAKWSTNQKN